MAQGFHGTLRLLWMFEIGVLGWVETPLAERCGVWKAYGGQPIDVHPPILDVNDVKAVKDVKPWFRDISCRFSLKVVLAACAFSTAMPEPRS